MALTGTIDPDAERICKERAAELHAFRVVLCMEATAQFIPTSRCRSVYPKVHKQSMKLNEYIRFEEGNVEEVSRTAATIGKNMAALLPPDVISEIAGVTGTVKLISDDPLEFLQIDGDPLPLRHTTVRIPATPGFVLTRQFELAVPIVLSPGDFKEVLIIRTSEPTDPVYAVIETMCEKLRQRVGINAINLVDARSRTDLVRALEKFSGALAVFDGHGIHSRNASGELVLGRSSVNVLNIDNLRMPRIVFLAACDTHPADRRQDSTAAALLLAGARTVVGTMAPVGAIESSALLTYLFYYIFSALPTYSAPVCWSELFSAAQRTTYVSEGLMRVRRSGVLAITELNSLAIELKSLETISNFRRSWSRDLYEDLAICAHVPVASAIEAWNRVAYFPDALLHCQLGHADSIFLTPTDNYWDDYMRTSVPVTRFSPGT